MSVRRALLRRALPGPRHRHVLRRGRRALVSGDDARNARRACLETERAERGGARVRAESREGTKVTRSGHL